MVKYCNKCGKELSDSSLFCKFCGHKIKSKVASSDKSFCYSCGKELSNHAIFCKHCGTKQFEDSVRDQKQFSCEYCKKEFPSETDCLKHEKNCSDNPLRKETKQERIIIQQVPKSRSKFLWIIVLVAVVLIVIIAINSNTSNTSSSSGGIVQRAITTSQCEIDYYSCVHDCGDGALSSLCKEKCTWVRSNCKG